MRENQETDYLFGLKEELVCFKTKGRGERKEGGRECMGDPDV